MSGNEKNDARDDASVDATNWDDAAPLHYSGRMVQATYAHSQAPVGAPLSGTTCVELTVRSDGRPTSRPAERVASRIIEPDEPRRPQYSGPAARTSALPAPAPATIHEFAAAQHAQPAEPPAGQELIKFHRMMRGRYKWAILLALLGLAGGAYAGWDLGKKWYQSTGMVRVLATVPKVLYDTPDKGVMPMFEQYVETQASLLRSQRVRDMAMDSPEWASLHRGKDDEAKIRFADSVTVTRNMELISVQVVDTDPTAARVAADALISAFTKLSSEQENDQDLKRRRALENVARDHRTAVADIQKRIDAIVEVQKTDDVRSKVSFQLEHVQKWEAAVAEIKMRLAAMGRAADAPQTQPTELTVEQMAEIHPGMQRLLAERADAEREIRRLEADKRIGESHNSMKMAKASLEAVKKEIDTLAEEVKLLQAEGMGPTALRGALNESQLQDQLQLYEGELGKLREKLNSYTSDAILLEKLRTDEGSIQRDLDQTQREIEQLDVEKTFAGRIVPGKADRPLGPYKDTRITFAAAGGLGGAMLGFGLITGLALMNRRVRSPEEAVDDQGAPLLGLLPRLSLDLADPEEAATAAHCVHEIRTLLQIWGRTRGMRVFAVTSPSAGTGKTSLTLALGSAFALAGRRTLLIDCDLVGGGLTTRVDAIIRRRIGRILQAEGLVTEDQLNEALRLSQRSTSRLGEMLVQLGYINERELNRAIMLQENDQRPVGLLDATAGHPLDECILEVGVDNLWALSAGGADARHVPSLTPEGLQHVIQSAREHFDIVLIDTGPVPGSLEASLATALADGVILTVSKGEHKAMIQRSINQLISVGARLTGLVFNRANHVDVSRYGSSSGQSQRGGLSRGQTPFAASQSTARFGPLAQAVTSFSPGVSVDPTIQAADVNLDVNDSDSTSI